MTGRPHSYTEPRDWSKAQPSERYAKAVEQAVGILELDTRNPVLPTSAYIFGHRLIAIGYIDDGEKFLRLNAALRALAEGGKGFGFWVGQALIGDEFNSCRQFLLDRFKEGEQVTPPFSERDSAIAKRVLKLTNVIQGVLIDDGLLKTNEGDDLKRWAKAPKSAIVDAAGARKGPEPDGPK